MKLLQMRVLKSALRLGDVDMTGGDEEDAMMDAVSDSDDPDLAQANRQLQGMRRGVEVSL